MLRRTIPVWSLIAIVTSVPAEMRIWVRSLTSLSCAAARVVTALWTRHASPSSTSCGERCRSTRGAGVFDDDSYPHPVARKRRSRHTQYCSRTVPTKMKTMIHTTFASETMLSPIKSTFKCRPPSSSNLSSVYTETPTAGTTTARKMYTKLHLSTSSGTFSHDSDPSQYSTKHAFMPSRRLVMASLSSGGMFGLTRSLSSPNISSTGLCFRNRRRFFRGRVMVLKNSAEKMLSLSGTRRGSQSWL
mmetsp:Transcript_15276/g.50188  ORF Transcript_15276/g.50188 Transcript_15276/m.50188 type:complete len:245 (+) Transcript_15276:283-1017(+)